MGRRTHARLWDFSRMLRLHRLGPVPVLAAAGVALLLASFTWERCGFSGCPDVARLAAYQAEGGTVLLDRDGEQFAVLRPVQREVVPLSELPEHVGAAFLAVEDKRFFRHDGVDWVRVLGAAVENVRHGDVAEGASTITMQLARNVFPERLPATERTFRRKLLEARVASEIEDRFTKQEILELYLNHIYFGGGAYGVEAASRYYFGEPATELTVPQAALLAAVVKAPSHYDPRRHPEAARARRDLVLALIEQQGRVSAERVAEARESELAVIDQPLFRGQDPGFAPYFVQEIRRVVEERFGEEVYTSRLRVHTTLDPAAQDAAEEELARQLEAIESGRYGAFRGPKFSDEQATPSGSPFLQGAVVVMESRTGEVLAMVGGRDYRASTFNRATRSRRQVGSAFKPFVFATAIARGYPPSQPIADEPVTIQLAANRSWEPENYDRDYYGRISLRESLVFSRNIPTVRLASAIGEPNIAQLARQAGVRSDVPEDPAMALGAASLTPLELTTAYATFANMGDAVEPRMIRRVESAEGEILLETGVAARQALDPAVSYVLTDILRDAVDYGTGATVRSAGFQGAAAGKTGTTSEGRDVWFMGYTPDLVAGVWIGFDQPRTIMRNATGGRLAAPVWGRVMRRVYDERPAPEAWRAPATVVIRRVDSWTGEVLAANCNSSVGDDTHEMFISTFLPPAVCPRRPSEGGHWLGSILRALGIGSREDQRDRDETRRSRTAEELRIEELLGAPPVMVARDGGGQQPPAESRRGRLQTAGTDWTRR